MTCSFFLAASYVERLRNNIHLTAALTGITAATVGMIGVIARPRARLRHLRNPVAPSPCPPSP